MYPLLVRADLINYTLGEAFLAQIYPTNTMAMAYLLRLSGAKLLIYKAQNLHSTLSMTCAKRWIGAWRSPTSSCWKK